MSELATYSFLPWVRQGLGNSIREAETDANPGLRATFDVTLTVHAQAVAAAVPDATVTRSVRLFGPGDVIGVDRRAIVKTEPRDWITNFEPNYLVHVEFYDEDFPWRYTPAKPDQVLHRNRPWLALVVLEESEFKDGDARDKPLPLVEIADLTCLPPFEQLWAWAHVQVNQNLAADENQIVSDDGAAIGQRLVAALAENADLAYSRVISPRKLEANKAYHAFLMPSFETGRVAGLGLDVSKVDDAMRGAWQDHAQRASLSPNSFPYYHRFYFRTGNAGDFEYLVRLLKPQILDARVGRRDFDVQRPYPGLTGIAGPNGDGVLRLGGALKVPDRALDEAEKAEAARFEHWADPSPHPFQRELAAFINLANEYAVKTAEQAHESPALPDAIGALPGGATDPDPLITPPLYARWHALTQRLLTQRDGSDAPNLNNWVHQLNLDPRHRASAGLGTKVVRDGQETYMNAAWAQIGEVLEANRLLRLSQLAKSASLSWFSRSVAPLATSAPERLLALSGPLLKRVVVSGFTVHKLVRESRVPLAMTSTTLRRALRPGAKLVRGLGLSGTAHKLTAELTRRLNLGSLVTAQAPTVPPGGAKAADVASGVAPKAPIWLLDLLRKYENAPRLLLLLGCLLAVALFMIGALPLALLVLGAVIFGYFYLRSLARDLAAADAVAPGDETPASVDTMPTDSGFTVAPFGSPFTPARGGVDSAQAQRFKEALRSAFELSAEAAVANRVAPRAALALSSVAVELSAGIDPKYTIARRAYRNVRIPSAISAQLAGDPAALGEVMAYPRIDTPMYEPLRELGSELFLPNVGLIPQNSITLLETNQAFIESYMVGLNHEFSRELLWREYPTDQRGSYFRQFWDVSGYLDSAGLSAADVREKMYDIPKLHRWDPSSTLGDHDNRQPPGSPPKQEVVLAIRGELLKRYPTAVIYAQRADWQRTGGVIDKSLIRKLIELGAAEENAPPRTKLKTPLYAAKVDPDITFFGFDLTVDEAVGNPDTDDAGWFFVIKERPGEPRFGLDIERNGAPINTWSDLAWDDVTTEHSQIAIKPGMQTYQLTTPPPASEGPEEIEQYEQDRQLAWNEHGNAADLAYILYQLPVLVAVHAAEMMPRT
jgi:hypothetical protein